MLGQREAEALARPQRRAPREEAAMGTTATTPPNCTVHLCITIRAVQDLANALQNLNLSMGVIETLLFLDLQSHAMGPTAMDIFQAV